MLTTATEMLKRAREGRYAVGHFNINNLEWAKAVLLTAEELRSPVILVGNEREFSINVGSKDSNSVTGDPDQIKETKLKIRRLKPEEIRSDLQLVFNVAETKNGTYKRASFKNTTKEVIDGEERTVDNYQKFVNPVIK